MEAYQTHKHRRLFESLWLKEKVTLCYESDIKLNQTESGINSYNWKFKWEPRKISQLRICSYYYSWLRCSIDCMNEFAQWVVSICLLHYEKEVIVCYTRFTFWWQFCLCLVIWDLLCITRQLSWSTFSYNTIGFSRYTRNCTIRPLCHTLLLDMLFSTSPCWMERLVIRFSISMGLNCRNKARRKMVHEQAKVMWKIWSVY